MAIISFGDQLLFDKIDTDPRIEGSQAGLEGAQDVERFNQQGIQALADSLGITAEQLGQFISAGQRQLPGLERGATPEGFDENLGKIFASESFQNLKREQALDIEGILSRGGNVRSGEALDKFSKLSPELGFSIENLLSGRSERLAGQGLGAATSLANIRAGTTGNIASLFADTGGAFLKGRTFDSDRELRRALGVAEINSREAIEQQRGERKTASDVLDFFSFGR